MNWAVIIAVAGFLVQLIVVCVGAAWVVGQIKTTTEKLGLSIKHLAQAVETLNKWLTEVDGKVDQHGERLAALEAKIDNHNHH